MKMQRITKAGLVTATLAVAGIIGSNTSLQASGYLMASGMYGEVICIPGGSDDCASTKPVMPSWPGDQG